MRELVKRSPGEDCESRLTYDAGIRYCSEVIPCPSNCPIVRASREFPLSEPPLVTSFFGIDDLLGLLQNEILSAIGCKGATCRVIAAILPAVVAPEAAEGEAGAAVGANKLNHIFGNPDHNLDSLVQQFGSQEAAYAAMNQAVIQQLGTGGAGTFSVDINLGGSMVTVTGAFVDGVPRIGTAYVR